MTEKWNDPNLAWPVEPPKPAIKSLKPLQRLSAMAEDKPLVFDTRPDDHNSLSVLPRLGTGEFDRLQEFYKFEWLTTWGEDDAMAGELYFGLYAIELKAGPAIVQPRVFDQDGEPADGVLMWFSWPGAEGLDPAAHPRYKETGVHGWTDATGSCGWAYSGDAHIGDNGGPFTVWCNSGEGPLGSLVGSDALDRIGFWDDHITPNPWFQVARKGGTTPPSGDGYRLASLDAEGNVLGYVDLTNGPPPGNTDKGSLALMDGDDILAHVDWS